jgi:hypothetical protein
LREDQPGCRVRSQSALGVSIKRPVSTTIADHALTREALEQHLGDQVRASLHVAEGISAFREKRQPCYE